jgi:serine protease Do
MTEKNQIVKIVKKAIPAVVSITVSKYLPTYENPFKDDPFGFDEFFSPPKKKQKVRISGGSGFIVDKSGIIITNRHVVIDPKAEYVVVINEEEKAKAKVLARDPINDIAIVKIERKEDLPVLKLGNSDKLDLGETAVAIGNTLGTFQNTISLGVVSGLSRKIKAVDVIEKKTQNLRGLIQTDAAINPGNSGGPLVNIKGKVIGVNAAMVFGAENVGFAIPINAARKGLEDLKKYGKIRQPFLGIRYVPVYKEIKEKYNLPADHGILVVREQVPEGKAIIPGSPAEKAGIKEADIILKIKDKEINKKDSFEDLLNDCQVGEEISLKILRGKKEIKTKAVLVDKK